MAWNLYLIWLAVSGCATAYVIKHPYQRQPERIFGFDGYQCPTAAYLGHIFGELSHRFNIIANTPHNPNIKHQGFPFFQHGYHNHHGRPNYLGHSEHYPPPPPPPPMPMGSFYGPLSPPSPAQLWEGPLFPQQQFNRAPVAMNPWNLFPRHNPPVKPQNFPNYPQIPSGFPEGRHRSYFPQDNKKNINAPDVTEAVRLQPEVQPHLVPQSQLQPRPQLQPQPQSDTSSQLQPNTVSMALGERILESEIPESKEASELTESKEEIDLTESTDVQDYEDVTDNKTDTATLDQNANFTEFDRILHEIFHTKDEGIKE